jgi:Spy/CpxP family protein refolding chaperone
MIRKMMIASLLLSGLVMAQAQPPQGRPGKMGEKHGNFEQGGPMHDGPMHPLLPPGRWWKNAEVAKTVGLSDEQVQKIEKVFEDSRLKLVDAHANLQKEEIRLEPLLDSESPEESAVLGAIDRITTARAAVEKANAQMAFAIRRVLTPEQWKKLRAIPPRHGNFPGPAAGPRGEFREPHGGPDGPGGPQAEGLPPAPPEEDNAAPATSK